MAEGMVGGMFSTATNLMQMGLNYKQNAQLMAQQKELNEQMRHDAHNAYTIATADRLRAGLSPIDGQPAQVANMTTAQQSPYSDLSKLGEGIQSAISQEMQNDLNKSTMSVNNSVASKNYAETLMQTEQMMDYINLRRERLEAKRAEYNNIKDKGSSEAQQIKNQLEIQEKELQKMTAQIDNMRSQTARNIWDLNWYSTVNLPVGTSINERTLSAGLAKNIAEQSNAKEADRYRVEYENKIKQDQDKQGRVMYQEYLSRYDTQKKELDTLVYKGVLTRDQAREKLGKRLSYNEWKKWYY